MSAFKLDISNVDKVIFVTRLGFAIPSVTVEWKELSDNLLGLIDKYCGVKGVDVVEVVPIAPGRAAPFPLKMYSDGRVLRLLATLGEGLGEGLGGGSVELHCRCR